MRIILDGGAGLIPFMEFNTGIPEFIVAAACLGPATSPSPGKPQPLIVSLPRPARHSDILPQKWCPPHSEQGFLTSHGRFVDRSVAYNLAYACHQIKSIEDGTTVWTSGTELFTEDLW